MYDPEEIKNLRLLLTHKNIDNIELALQIIQGRQSVPKELLEELSFAHLRIRSSQKEWRGEIWALLQTIASPLLLKRLSKISKLSRMSYRGVMRVDFGVKKLEDLILDSELDNDKMLDYFENYFPPQWSNKHFAYEGLRRVVLHSGNKKRRERFLAYCTWPNTHHKSEGALKFALELGHLKTIPENVINYLTERLVFDISFKECDLEIIPKSFFDAVPHLEFLRLTNNKLKSIPDEICKLRKLKKIDLNNNLLESLPASFSQLQQLEILAISANSFDSIPQEVLALKNLRSLQIKGHNKKGKNKIVVDDAIRKALPLCNISTSVANYSPQ